MYKIYTTNLNVTNQNVKKFILYLIGVARKHLGVARATATILIPIPVVPTGAIAAVQTVRKIGKTKIDR